jgi:hypothetical protein
VTRRARRYVGLPLIKRCKVVNAQQGAYNAPVPRHQEYWFHPPSGFVWAVHLTDNEIVCASGPLHVAEADADILPYLDYSIPDGAWVREHRGEFITKWKPRSESREDRPSSAGEPILE